MSTPTFDFAVDTGTSGVTTFSTIKAQFGDGYSQEAANGLNNKSQQWTVQISNVYASDLAPIIAFLDALGGYQSFYWTPPDGVQGLYRCNTYTSNPDVANLRNFQATFQQVFSA